jgi:hypothetical protein
MDTFFCGPVLRGCESDTSGKAGGLRIRESLKGAWKYFAHQAVLEVSSWFDARRKPSRDLTMPKRPFSKRMLLNLQKSLLPELSNSGSPPAKPGVYPDEIIHVITSTYP